MILDLFIWVNQLKIKFQKFFTLTEKFVRNDEKMIDPDFVQDHTQKVPEGKEDLNA